MKHRRIARSGLRALRRNPLRTFLMTLGIAVGIAALTVIVATGEAARDKVIGRMQVFGSDAMMVMAGGGRRWGFDNATTTLTEADALAIKEGIPGVKNVGAAMMERSQAIIRQERNTSALIIGVSPEWASAWRWAAEVGESIGEEDVASMARVCVLGSTVAKEVFDEEDPIGASIRINQVPFQVKGVLTPRGTSPGGGDMDNRVLVPISTAARRLFNRTHLSNMRVQVRDPSQIHAIASQIQGLLRERHRITPPEPDDFQVRTPDAVAERIAQMSGTMSWFLVAVAAISLFVGGIVVMNVMLISVRERVREIGLRMAVGARRRDIGLQFIIEAVVVAFLGGLGGLALGFAGAEILTRLTDIPTVVSWRILALGTGFSAVVGLVFGIHPARQAAAQDPVEALR